MKLACRAFGPEEGVPVIFLHGLLGSSRNWASLGRALGMSFPVYALDLRNHGESPEAETMTFEEMKGDVRAFLDEQRIAACHLVGHSLGGKVAMRLAMDNPARLHSLTVVDIAPRDYGLHFQNEYEAMLAIPLQTMTSRKAIDDALAASVPDWALRQFLLTNLRRLPDGRYCWTPIVYRLPHCLESIRRNSLHEHEVFQGRTLFLTGANSNFVTAQDHARIRRYFPCAEIIEIPDAGHNVHFDQSERFLQSLRAFLSLT